jgi:hypothetical protein
MVSGRLRDARETDGTVQSLMRSVARSGGGWQGKTTSRSARRHLRLERTFARRSALLWLALPSSSGSRAMLAAIRRATFVCNQCHLQAG